MLLRFELEDRCGFEAGDWNKRRYVKNGPTNATDSSAALSVIFGVIRPLQVA